MVDHGGRGECGVYSRSARHAGLSYGVRVDREVRSPNGDLISHDERYFNTTLNPEKLTHPGLVWVC